MKNRNIYGNIGGYGPFDKLRKKRTGSIYDATTRYGGKIDLPAIAGVVEAGRRTQRKAGETAGRSFALAIQRNIGVAGNYQRTGVSGKPVEGFDAREAARARQNQVFCPLNGDRPAGANPAR